MPVPGKCVSHSARGSIRLSVSLLSLLLSLLTRGPDPGSHPCPQTLPGLFSQGGGEGGDRAGTGWIRDGDKVLAPGEAAPSFDRGPKAPSLSRCSLDEITHVNATHNQGPKQILLKKAARYSRL